MRGVAWRMPHETSVAMLAVAGLLFVVGTAAYIACFVLAATTKKLGVADYVIGTLGATCGIGFLYFLARANTVTLQHSFDLIHAGGDPAASRALNQRFKYAAGAAIMCWVATYFVAHAA